MLVTGGGYVGQESAEKLGDRRFAIEMIRAEYTREDGECKRCSVSGGREVRVDNGEEAGGDRVELVPPRVVDSKEAGAEEREQSVIVKRAGYR